VTPTGPMTRLVQRAAPAGQEPGARRPGGAGRSTPPCSQHAGNPHRTTGPGRALSIFVVIAVLAVVAVAAGTVVVSQQIAERGAVEEAERTAVRVAQHVVAPVLGEALAGVPDRWQELDRQVAQRLSEGAIDSVTVWTAPGEIVFSSEQTTDRLVAAPMRELRAAWAGTVVAQLDETPEGPSSRPAAAGEGPQLEVYVPLTIAGQQLAAEILVSHEGIERQAAVLKGEMIPLTVGSLLLLQVVQVPIAVWLVRRVRRHEVERTDLLARIYTASERERRSIASDVHDGPVQELAGVSYALSALRAGVPADRQGTVDRLVSSVREAVGSLRRLIVDLYPPDLSGPGLAPAVDDLADRLRAQGVEVTLTAEPLPDLAPDVAAAVYRSAKEALVNAEKHASATRVWVDLALVDRDGTPAVRLVVDDDGVGLGPADTSTSGHLGLRMVRDRATDLGGTARVGERPGGGASIEVVVPARSAPACLCPRTPDPKAWASGG
jgi:two-component system NarL family sensor kinase